MNACSAKILVVDDERDVAITLASILTDEGYDVVTHHTALSGLECLASQNIDVCLLDIWLPDIDGLQVLEKIRQSLPDLPVIMISGHANIEAAIRFTKLGAFDFIEKPFSLEKLLISVQNAVKMGQLRTENQALRSQIESTNNLLGVSQAIDQVRRTAQIVAERQSTVLITGENGTGKEIVARMIHEHSKRSKRAFIDINCAAIPEDLIESELFGHQKGAFTGAISLKRGKFELAHGGTLFLDEVGDMSLRTQSKVLRVLQEQRFERIGGDESISVDVRIVAATNKDLLDLIKSGLFREDLYYRLNVIPIHLPALRERGAHDIELLATYYLEKYCTEYAIKRKYFTPDALSCLTLYSWPGNVRELRNLMERLSIMVYQEEIDVRDLPGMMQHVPQRSGGSFLPTQQIFDIVDMREARAEFERIFIQKKLEECGGNVSKTAELIGLERSNLHRKMKFLDSSQAKKVESDGL